MSAPAVVTMRKVCSWCGLLIQAGHGPASHGICEGCRERYFGKRGQPTPELPHAPAGTAGGLT